jgi:tetratricopeptide (TPR) repeat protein
VLRALEDASLLDRQPGGRYTMHDLIRAYATHTANDNLAEDTRRAALRRVLDFYLHTAHSADGLMRPHRSPIHLDQPAPSAHSNPLPDDRAAMAWFDTEHRNLLAAQHTATSRAWHPIVWQLAWTLDTFHRRRGHRNDRLAVWRAALNAATHWPDSTTSIHTQRALGSAFAELGRHGEATWHLHQALALAEHHHDPAQQAHTHQMLATAWERRGDHRRALEHTTYALGLYRTLDRPVWAAEALNAMGWYTAQLGDYDNARVHCHAALTLHQHHHNPGGEAATRDSLGYIDTHTGHHHQAVGQYRQALSLFRDLGYTYRSADVLDRFGHPHAALHQHEQARAMWREALDLYQQQGRDEDAARVQRQLDELDQCDDATGFHK